MKLAECRYIAIEGPIGVGKSSLARKLSDHLRANLLLEGAGGNPFLASFYQDMSRYALPAQMFFLFQRVEQVRGLKQIDLFDQPTVADFMLEKDPLFAQLTLNDDEYRLYQQMYQHMQLQAPTPDLVIYLQASLDALLSRVRKRGIAYERNISDDYLTRLAERYSEFFYQYDAAPLLIVNSTNLDFVNKEADFQLLLERIEAMRGGREFFSRGK